MSFQNLNLHFPTPDAFRAWLATCPAVQWRPVGSTYHNTFTPDEAQWRGRSSMLSMQRFYAAKGWTTGPHCYCASGTSDDGIWVMCPPWLEGIHAGPCNESRFGLEVVGNFQSRPMSHNQLVLLSEAAAALHDWQQIGADIVAHRDCMPGRTCPGDSAYAQKDAIQTLLAFALHGSPRPHYTDESPILGTGTIPSARWIGVLRAKQTTYQLAALGEIVTTYLRICREVGLNSDLAISQMIHETGWLTSWWCLRPRRNPAGIGVTGRTFPVNPGDGDWAYNPLSGRWHAGLSFPTWADDAIPAHLGRLLGYALKPGQMTAAQRALYQEAVERRPLPPAVVGSAQTIKQLGKAHNPSGQGWASPGNNYGAAMSAIANQLLETP